MEWSHIRLALATGLILAPSAMAQDAPIVEGPVAVGGPLPPEVVATAPAPVPVPARPGFLGWRARHAAKKRHLQDALIGYPEEFCEWPLGRSLYSQGRAMVAEGEAARMIFNHYDFVGDTTELNYRGLDKLAWISGRLPTTFAPVIVERTPTTPGVDERRRLAVLGMLARGPFPVPAERVLVGPPIATGLRGQDSARINASRLGQYDNGGGSIAGGLDPSGLSGSAGDSGTSGVGTSSPR